MKKLKLFLIITLGVLYLGCNKTKHPDAPVYKNEKFLMPEEIYGDFYREIQVMNVIPGKEFSDAVPKREPKDIYNDFRRAKNDRDFEVMTFLKDNFELPSREFDYINDSRRDINESIEMLWSSWKKTADKVSNNSKNSLIPLPHDYMVIENGGYDINYWHSYFIMLGNAARGEWEMVENMADNFAYLIDEVGHVPPSNRSYHVSRSHFPMFVEMVELLASERGDEVYIKYLPHLETEYSYWMRDSDKITEEEPAIKNVMRAQEYILNRYWDENVTPRAERYRSDTNMEGDNSRRPGWAAIRELRASTESGWNFTSRFFSRPRSFWSNITTKVVPVDLNSMMYKYEVTLAKAHELNGNKQKEEEFLNKASIRKKAITQFMWDPNQNIFTDYDSRDSTLKERFSLATVFPLYIEVASQEQADTVAYLVEKELLEEGGLMTSTINSRQRWDAPNGWAHLHWITYKAMKRYNHDLLAQSIAQRWISTVEKTYQQTGRFEDFYNVEELEENFEDDGDTNNYAWTVGVYLAFKKELGK